MRPLPPTPSQEGEPACSLRSPATGRVAEPSVRVAPSAQIILLTALALTACSTAPRRTEIERTPVSAPASTTKPALTSPTPAPKRGGGYYKDDGPGENMPTPEALAAIPDAVPRAEPLHRFANRPYVVFNREYVPQSSPGTYKAQGIGSWYGRKFHGQRTSTGETYDMFGMTAAHTTLPIPSYARVTNPANGRSVVVRVNDRGPFHADRIIDLSYAAAWKLGYIGSGSALVNVESILPGTLPPSSPMIVAPVDPLAELIRRTEQQAPPVKVQNDAQLPETTEARGIFLQLGAFSSPDNAENLKARLASELAEGTGNDLAGKLLVQTRAGIYRVQLGPWPDQNAARQVASRLRELLDIQPVVVQQ